MRHCVPGRFLFWLVVIATVLFGPVRGQCSDSTTHSTRPKCVELFEFMQTALFQTRENPFQLQSVFSPSSHLEPTLVNVSYTLNYTTGLTPCGNCTPSNPCLYAWTKRSMYQFFHPAVVNQLQFLLPFALMRLTDLSLSDEPDLDAYLWDGVGSLPSVKLNVTVNSSSLSGDMQQYLQNCTPEAMDTVQNALRELTKWVCYSTMHNHFYFHVITAQGICKHSTQRI